MSGHATLKQKLLAGFGAVILTMLAGTAYSMFVVYGLTSVVSQAAGIHDQGKIATLSSDMVGLERGIVLHSIFDDKARVAEYTSEYDAASQSFDTLLRTMDATGSADNKSVIEALRGKRQEWTAMHNEIMGLLASQQVDVAQKKISDAAFLATASDVQRLANEMAERSSGLLRSQAGAAKTRSLTGSVVAVALSLGVGTFVLLDIRRVSDKMRRVTEALAEGSAKVSARCEEVSAASQSLAQGSSEQAASLQETASSTEEIAAMTRQNAVNSQSAAEVMSAVDRNIREGNRTLDQMMVSMKEINSSSDKISKIIKVIDEIAFQTNILALNAAVEAARAGTAGMGFAVVADEVRNLAQRSAQAARDTAGLIEESIARSSDGSSKLQQVTGVIRSITESASRVKTLVDEVNAGSQEQARGIEQITRAVSQMDRVTMNTVKSSEETASSSRELTSQADALNQAVSELRLLIGSAR
jgi:methyl-accepting chemotaxis protein